MTTASCCNGPVAASELTVAEARQRVLLALRAIDRCEDVPLRAALGRVLADDLHATRNVPGHDNAAMDGIALSSRDLPATGHSRTLRCIGSVLAGHPYQGQPLSAGDCLRIMTGAAMPPGSDTVIMQEQLHWDGVSVTINDRQHAGQHVRHAGEDIAADGCVYRAGHVVTAADLGVLASLGMAAVPVIVPPRVAFFSTGDELRSLGQPLEAGQIYDSNRYSLHGLLKQSGVELLDLGMIRDQPDALRDALRTAASKADVVITSGGVSVGEADFIKPLLQQLGDIDFWQLAMKPGRPLAFGRLRNSLFFGLPGNPVATMVAFCQFVFPVLYFLQTGKPFHQQSYQARCRVALHKKAGRSEFVRGSFSADEQGALQVEVLTPQGSGVLTSMSRGNCFIALDEQCTGVQPGETVLIQPFSQFRLG